MKINSIATSSLVVLSLLFTAAGAYAQSAVQAHVPFAFKVGTAQMPAGTYTLKRESDSRHHLDPQRQDRQSVLAVGTAGNLPPRQTEKLVFRHHGRQYFLTEIWGDAGNPGMVLPAPKAEGASRPPAGHRSPGSTVEIAAK